MLLAFAGCLVVGASCYDVHRSIQRNSSPSKYSDIAWKIILYMSPFVLCDTFCIICKKRMFKQRHFEEGAI